MAPKTKPKRTPAQGSIEVNLTGNVGGQVAVGSNIKQTQNISKGMSALSEEDRALFSALIAEFRQKVRGEAPEEQKDEALEKASELEQAITAEEPNVSTMEHVKDWFVKNIPALAGTVTGLIVNPIVGKLVEAAGETVAHEFKLRFGSAGS